MYTFLQSIDLGDEHLEKDGENHLISNIKKKRQRNKKLGQLRARGDGSSPRRPPPKSLSFNYDGTRAVEPRVNSSLLQDHNGHLKPPTFTLHIAEENEDDEYIEMKERKASQVGTGS